MDDHSEILSTLRATQQSKPLGVTTPILQDETFRGYMERLAYENVYVSANWISRLLAESGKPFAFEWFKALSQLTEVSQIELLAALKRERGPLWGMQSERDLTLARAPETIRSEQLLGRHLRNASNRSFCPRCLDEAPYERSTWLSKYSLCCLKHECFLVRQCPECRSAVHVSALVADFCLKCGARLSKAPASDIDPANTGGQVLLDHWWGGAGDIRAAIPKLPEASNSDLYRVFIGIVSVCTGTRFSTSRHNQPPVSSFPKNVQEESEGHGLAESVARAYEAISDWPCSFHNFLDSVRRRHGRSFGESIPQDFLRLYDKYLEKEWLEIQFVQRSFEDFLPQHYQYCYSLERSRRYQENPDFRSRFEYVSYHEAARRLGVHLGVVERLAVHEAFLQEFPHKVPYDRGQWVHSFTVDYLSEQFVMYKSVASCASFLGVPEDVIREFVRRGLLTKTSNGSGEVSIEGRSLMELSFRYRSAMSSIGGPLVHILDAVEDLRPYNWNLADIVESILCGQLHAMGGAVAITSSFVSGADLEKIKVKHLEQFLIHEATPTARAFGVDPTRVLNWYVLGILPRKATGDGNPFDMSQEDISSFRDKYVSFREAARIVELPESTFADYATKGRFKEVGRRIKGRRSGLFRRVEVERFAPGRTLSPGEIKRRYKIDPHELEQWVQSGRLTRLSGPGIDGCTTPRYAREDIELCIG